MKYLVLLSGGQDSTTCLYWCLERAKHNDIKCIFFDYGQRHATIEGHAAKFIARNVGVGIDARKVSFGLPTASSDLLSIGTSIKTSDSGLPTSFVPGRNLLMLSMAAAFFYPERSYSIVIGANAVDFSGYPDCRGQSLRSFEESINKAMDIDIRILSPLLDLTKSEIVNMGLKNGAHDVMSMTHTCYYGEFPPCGECPACKIRQAGFRDANINDPLEC